MKRLIFRKNTLIVIAIDFILVCGAFYFSFLLRFDFPVPAPYAGIMLSLLPLVLLVKAVVFYRFDFYRGMWRYTSLADLLNMVKATILSTLIIAIVILFMNRFENVPRSVLIIDWFLTLMLVAGSRSIIRLYFDLELSPDGNLKEKFRQLRQQIMGGKNILSAAKWKRLLIIGAGKGGEKILREIQTNSSLGYIVVGFLDDNPYKIGMKIHGVPVLNNIAAVSDIAAKRNVDEIIIAISSATAEQMRTIISLCGQSGVRFRTIPGYEELLNGRVPISSLREVSYQDLLGREVVTLDKEQIGSYLQGKNVIITGAGGSIGSELSRQVCRFGPARIILLERAENSLYEIDLELRYLFKDSIEIVAVLGDVQDIGQLEAVFDAYRPQVVFHAAAYKHVPILEVQPWKAIKNNIRATQNLAEISKKYDVERFVFVSTDKAVRPANIMGASKRIAEILLQSQNRGNYSGTQFKIVRFGNVIGSSGSVIPLFQKQIARGGPVTVTHPEVTRYFMTISEACQLILQAGAINSRPGSNAEVYILKMGTPIRIAEMARDLIRISGFRPEADIKIEYTGLRPGEKLYEELITEGEDVVPTAHKKIMVLNGQESDLTVLSGNIDKLVALAEQQDNEKIRELLQEMLPEYLPARN